MGTLGFNPGLSKIIALEGMGKDASNIKDAFRTAVHDFIDLVKVRIKETSIDEAANSLLPLLFKLRIFAIECLIEEGESFENLLDKFDEIAKENQSLTVNKKTGEASSDIIYYSSIINKDLFAKLDISSFDQLDKSEITSPSYEAFNALKFHTSPKVRLIKDWMDASLKVDFGLILTDLILVKSVKLSDKKINQSLIPFLYNSLEVYGAHSIFTDYWTPSDEDRSDSFINRMCILAATLSLDHGLGEMVSSADLSELLGA